MLAANRDCQNATNTLQGTIFQSTNLQKPTNAQSIIIIEYKRCITFKHLISGTPSGFISFIQMVEESVLAIWCTYVSKFIDQLPANSHNDRQRFQTIFLSFCRKLSHTTANCYKKLNHAINSESNENRFGKEEVNIRNTSFSSQSNSQLFCS